MAISPIALLGDVYLDVVNADEPVHQSEVTEKAVEKGVDISDHMKAKPATLSISGVIVGDDAWQRLQKIRLYQDNKQLITYVNRVVYINMAIESISTSHHGGIGNGFSFTIALKQVRVVTPQEVQIINVPPAVLTKAKKETSAGLKQGTKTNSKKDNVTESLADRIRSFKEDKLSASPLITGRGSNEVVLE